MINTLQKQYNCAVGYSGHENGIGISTAAAALGITSLERHITKDRCLYGSDQAASLEPDAFRKLVGAVRKVELALGTGQKEPIREEMEVAAKLRAHISSDSEI